MLVSSSLSKREFEVAVALVSCEDKQNDMYERLGFKHRESLANIASRIYRKLGISRRDELRALWNGENFNFTVIGGQEDVTKGSGSLANDNKVVSAT